MAFILTLSINYSSQRLDLNLYKDGQGLTLGLEQDSYTQTRCEAISVTENFPILAEKRVHPAWVRIIVPQTKPGLSRVSKYRVLSLSWKSYLTV